MRRAAAAALACAGLVALAGCRQPPAPGPWIPRVAGSYWVYERSTPAGRSEVRVDALGEREIAELGRSVFLTEETRIDDDGFDAVNPVAYVVEDGYVAQIDGLVYDGARHLRVLGDAQPRQVLPLAPSPGLRWVQEIEVFTTGDRAAHLRWESEIRGRDALDVPAGRFGDVVEVHTTLRDAEGAVVGRYRDVFARGVGLVYGEALTGSEEPPHREELRLLRHRVPGDR